MAVWRIKAGADGIETEMAGVHNIMPPDQAATMTCFAGPGCAAFSAMAGADILDADDTD